MESGAVTDQTFAGGQAAMATPVLAIGAGDYSTFFNAASPKVVLTSDSTGAYPISSVKFG